MKPSFARDVRFAFASFTLALTVYAGLESVAASRRQHELAACGTQADPCVLAPLTVQAEGRAARLVRADQRTAGETVAEAVSGDRAMQHVTPVRKS